VFFKEGIMAIKAKAVRFLAGAIFAFMVSEAAFAAPTLTLTITSGSSTETKTVNITGPGTVVEFTGTVGDWTITPTQGVSGPVIDGAPSYTLSTTDSTLVHNAPALTVTLTETGLTFEPDKVTLTGNYTPEGFGPTSGVTYSSFYDVTHTIDAPFNLSGATSKSKVEPPTTIHPVGPYTVTLQTVIDANSTTPTIAEVGFVISSQTPEPGLYFLTGIGLAGLLAITVFRRKKLQA
jgi:hypothetical protein